ncbi:FecR domain-containing protein [Pedobacter sp. ASV1-7]|uniref:FecR family protein n=1 Tax=Pedobacter sp. ASV1-7 TaxID=3145237 RepID=UPI0032E87F27
MTNREFKELARKCHDNSASEEERIAFDHAYHLMLGRYTEWDREQMRDEETVKAEIYQSLTQRVILDQKNKTPKVKKRRYFYVAAAVVLVVGLAGLFYFSKREANQVQQQFAVKQEVVPGKQGATLILASGEKIVLSSADKGQLAQEAGVIITKTADGQLVYEIKNQSDSKKGQQNTLSTNKGETYQVRLPDGSMVWLNAASTLRYPVSFSGLKTRSVELDGEAYFEVAKNETLPFVVYTDREVVKVLGTHFNMSSYQDESISRTTLIEGKVSVSPNGKSDTGQLKVLKPGEQGEVLQGNIDVKKVNTEEVIAWKNDEFMFNNEDIRSVMNKISRWYDVEIVYKTSAKNVLIWGSISRFKSITDVLKLIELTGSVHFKVEGRRVFVME